MKIRIYESNKRECGSLGIEARDSKLEGTASAEISRVGAKLYERTTCKALELSLVDCKEQFRSLTETLTAKIAAIFPACQREAKAKLMEAFNFCKSVPGSVETESESLASELDKAETTDQLIWLGPKIINPRCKFSMEAVKVLEKCKSFLRTNK